MVDIPEWCTEFDDVHSDYSVSGDNEEQFTRLKVIVSDTWDIKYW